jgi:peptidyl-prolyl cis-trans isomerase SurA
MDGSLKFGAAVAKYSEDDNSKFTGGLLTAPDGSGSTFLTIDQLDKDMVLMLKDLKVGEFSKPTEFVDPSAQKKAVRIIEILSKSEPHRENLKDDYDKVAQRALEEKKNAALEDWFNKRLPDFYINISKEYASCPELQKWTQRSATAQK